MLCISFWKIMHELFKKKIQKAGDNIVEDNLFFSTSIRLKGALNSLLWRTRILQCCYVFMNADILSICRKKSLFLPYNIKFNSFQWRAEAVGCPGPTRFLDALENILYSSRKISDDLFLVVHLDFSLFSNQLSNFTRIRSLDAPPVLHHAPVTTFFYFFFGHLPTFFYKKTGLLDAPQGGFPGPSHRPHPLCTPLPSGKAISHILKCLLPLGNSKKLSRCFMYFKMYLFPSEG